MINISYFFFFSSRRRHTRLQGDWSSDVCSSDLHLLGIDRCASLLPISTWPLPPCGRCYRWLILLIPCCAIFFAKIRTLARRIGHLSLNRFLASFVVGFFLKTSSGLPLPAHCCLAIWRGFTG